MKIFIPISIIILYLIGLFAAGAGELGVTTLAWGFPVGWATGTALVELVNESKKDV